MSQKSIKDIAGDYARRRLGERAKGKDASKSMLKKHSTERAALRGFCDYLYSLGFEIRKKTS